MTAAAAAATAAAVATAAAATAAAAAAATDPFQRCLHLCLPVQLLHSVQRPERAKRLLISQAGIVVLLYEPPQLLSCMLQGRVLPRSDACHCLPRAGGRSCGACTGVIASKPAAEPAPSAAAAPAAAAMLAAAAAVGPFRRAACRFKGRPQLLLQLRPQRRKIVVHLRIKRFETGTGSCRSGEL